jgi:uncharacterized membrane protein YeaQ/YmgE (transglycosylase-associated protein family)
MPILPWILLGLVAGFIASEIDSETGKGAATDIALGIVGAVSGGWLFNTFGITGISGAGLYSVLVAVIGASFLLVVFHPVLGRAR